MKVVIGMQGRFIPNKSITPIEELYDKRIPKENIYDRFNHKLNGIYRKISIWFIAGIEADNKNKNRKEKKYDALYLT